MCVLVVTSQRVLHNETASMCVGDVSAVTGLEFIIPYSYMPAVVMLTIPLDPTLL